jgi:hypothetical protein
MLLMTGMTLHTYTINMGISGSEVIVGIDSEHDPSFEVRSKNLTLSDQMYYP